jgi:hypothetical protein
MPRNRVRYECGYVAMCCRGQQDGAVGKGKGVTTRRGGKGRSTHDDKVKRQRDRHKDTDKDTW